MLTFLLAEVVSLMAAAVLHKLFSCVGMRRTFSALLNWVLLNRVPMNRVLLNRVLLPTGLPGAEVSSSTRGCPRLVVGLGNPGMDRTRHNVGAAVVGALAARLGLEERWRADTSVCGDVIASALGDAPLVLLRPRQMMNVNGVSVAKAAAKYGVRPENILLVHDELDKALGKITIKHGGSARGHNGVRSCVQCLQTDVMLRLRVGIGRPAGRTSVERHVLTRFSNHEQIIVDSVLAQSVNLLLSQLTPPSSPPVEQAAPSHTSSS